MSPIGDSWFDSQLHIGLMHNWQNYEVIVNATNWKNTMKTIVKAKYMMALTWQKDVLKSTLTHNDIMA